MDHTFSNEIVGMCGNADDDWTNDMTKKNKQTASSVEDLVRSWTVGPNVRLFLFSRTHLIVFFLKFIENGS